MKHKERAEKTKAAYQAQRQRTQALRAIEQLKAAGWRVTANEGGTWDVASPDNNSAWTAATAARLVALAERL
jgi:hypothetical protein